ncbi:MAG: alpha-L-fucosidase, partial [Promethearchaeota archaeon]
MKFEATQESIKKHEVPEWFHDAKFGIFIHWSLSSVPAFAITGIDLVDSMKKGIEEHFKNNPYAEWYLNSLRISGSPTQIYHEKTYGTDFSYSDFVPIFNEEIKKWDPDEMAELFNKAGAKYVVLVTKHHDGFLLWPSDYSNPKKENYHASRDIVGELTAAVKKRGMKMGFYYSGALDWS